MKNKFFSVTTLDDLKKEEDEALARVTEDLDEFRESENSIMNVPDEKDEKSRPSQITAGMIDNSDFFAEK